MRTTRSAVWFAVAMLAVGSIGTVAAETTATPAPATLLDAFKQGKSSLGLRYRYELVDDDARAKEGRASTLRTALAFRTAPWKRLSAFLELEDVHAIFGDELYDNRGAGSLWNGVSDRGIVVDPESTELNQAYLDADLGTGTRLRVGRQEITHDDERFVGPVGWRQNHQSFDAVNLTSTALPKTSLSYSFVDNVNTVAGGDARLEGHWLTGSIAAGMAGKLDLFGYWLDYDASPASDSATWGAKLAGEHALAGGKWKLAWDLAYARQTDYADNPTEFGADYARVVLGLGTEALIVRVGGEQLGSDDGRWGFSTPLATLHKWNGWADKFLTTPADGLIDVYASLGGKRGAMNWILVWHDFSADRGSADYGTEIDAELTWKSSWGQIFGLKAAIYDADAHARDTTKVMVYSGWAM